MSDEAPRARSETGKVGKNRVGKNGVGKDRYENVARADVVGRMRAVKW